ncbi:MAG TPA: IS256 family transposase, partial [Limnochordia bacterium]|nr:IS256 family transposase [Limnochordia bacterium]
MQNLRKQLANELANDCKTVTDVRNAINGLFKDALEAILEAEITEHLGYEKHSGKGDNSGNSRNGSTKKTVQSRAGKSEILIPRDRNGEFEPQIIPKYQRNVNEIEEQVLAMYAKGLSTRDIEDHLNDIYGIDISAGLVSKITDKIMPLVAEWQSRPLEKVYPIVFLDAIHFRVRKDNRVLNKAAYSVLGINVSGHKDILGIWVGEAESASFWLGVCNDLKNRGVEDILIACKD